jgi:hypothetical protein
MVYQFYYSEHADAFEEMLNERKIKFERFHDEEGEAPRILFGVHKTHLKSANNANFLVHARFRKPFISNKWLKYLLLVVTFGAILLALIGYFKRPL